MDYIWIFGPLDVKLSENGMTNVVYNVNWRLIGVDGEYSASVYGSCGIQSPTQNEFTQYDQLTRSQVQCWVEESLGSEQVSTYKDNIAKQIELQKNPVSASLQSPWLMKNGNQ